MTGAKPKAEQAQGSHETDAASHKDDAPGTHCGCTTALQLSSVWPASKTGANPLLHAQGSQEKDAASHPAVDALPGHTGG